MAIVGPTIKMVGSKSCTQYVLVNSFGPHTSRQIRVLTDGLKTGVTSPGIASVPNGLVLTDGLKRKGIAPS